MDFDECQDSNFSELFYLFRKKIVTMDTKPFAKNTDKATEFRNKGNDAFAGKNYAAALEMYTEATIQAPYQLENKENEELALALANRSAALFHLKKYRECLEDIELSFRNGYPAKSRPKLILRKASCEQELSKLITNNNGGQTPPEAPPEATATEDPPKNSTTNSPNEQLDESEPFEVVENEKSGRGLVARRDLKKGEVILREKPLVSVLDRNYFKTHCYHCVKKLSQRPMPCRQCSQVRFCSQNCSDKSWDGYHSRECLYLDIFNIREDFRHPPKVAHRVLNKNGVGHSLAYRPINDGDTINSIKRSGYEGMFNLVEHPKEDKNDYSGVSAIVSAFIVESLSEKELFSAGTIEFLKERIIKHIRQTNVNGITITDKAIDSTSKDEPQLSEEEIGIGIYLTARLLNHSCEPNLLISHFEGDLLVLVAAKDIPKGHELFHCYGAHRKWQLFSQRQKLLKESYFFDCQCPACLVKAQPLNKAFKCTKCSGPVVADGPMTCVGCGAVDHLDVGKILADSTSALKILKIGKDYMTKGDQDKSQYLLAEQAFLEALDTMSAVLCNSHKEIVNVLEKLRLCAMKLSKFEEAVKWSQRLLEATLAEFDDGDFHVFNVLFKLVNCQKSLYLHLKSKSPVDKNAVNILKTHLLVNLDILQAKRATILSPGTREAVNFGQRLFVIRKLI